MNWWESLVDLVRARKADKMYVGMNYINGEWQEHSPDFSSLNPAKKFEQELGMFPLSDHTVVHAAVDAARIAFESWRKVSRVQRADYFDKLAQLVKRDHDRLKEAISLETGKNLNESHAEVIEALHMCQVAAASGRQPYGEVIASELSTKDAIVARKPKGVVAVVAPWNFPLAIGSFWSAAPAIVEGNCVVHKPSEFTPMVAQIAAELYDEAGFPPGVFNLIHGMGDTGKELVHDNRVDVILFTGSAEVGKEIRQHCAGTWHKTCSCEMGSKSATITFEDGDLDLAVEVSLASAFKLSGQRCVSSGRLLVQRTVYQEFCDRFVAGLHGKKLTGDPFEDPAPLYGPLINKEQLERVKMYNEMVRMDKHCEVLMYDNETPELVSQDGYFTLPLVYRCEWDNSKRYLVEEVFGPHAAIIPFDTVQDAIDIYNDTEYGLALGVVTDDYRTMKKCRDECNTGMLYLNGGSIAAESHLPFGGVGKSGNGWKSAAGTYRAVTEEIAVTTNYEHGVSWAQGMKS